MLHRIRELRERQNLNQEQLGDAVGVTRQTIAAWEKGQRQPSMTQLAQIARTLKVPVDLLLEQNQPPEGEPTLLFRADNPAVLTDTERAILNRRARDYADIERKVGALPLIPESRPMADYEPDAVERVAHETRDWLGVENAPLGDVFDLLERRGLKIIRTQLPDGVWGFSAYTEDWGGIIVVNTHSVGNPIPTERQYFTALHELGHLIFHRREYRRPATSEGRRDPRETAANHFEGAVLLPADALRLELRQYRNRWLPEPLLADLKVKYGVSFGTILHRAAQLGIITERQKGQQFGQLKKQYPHNHGEPPKPEVAAPAGLDRLHLLVFGALVNEQISTGRAAEILNTSLFEIRDELLRWLPEEDDTDGDPGDGF